MRWGLAVVAMLILAAPAMAFPAISSEATTSNTSTTSHAVNLPASLVNGRLLIACITSLDNPTMTWPAGWTAGTLPSEADAFPVVRLECRYRFVDGSEGASITIMTSSTESSVARVWQFSGAHSSSAPESCGSSCVQCSSTSCDPPSLTPSWGADDTRWMAVSANQREIVSVTYPTNYGTDQQQDLCDLGNFCGLASAHRDINAASEDPGAYTWGSANNGVGATIAVRSAAASRQRCIGCGTDQKVIGQ